MLDENLQQLKPCRFSNCVADADDPTSGVPGILTKMADAIFSSWWRILKPTDRSVNWSTTNESRNGYGG